MPKEIINHNEFDKGPGINTGGVTGSVEVKRNRTSYQLKPPIENAQWLRRRKANSLDTENFGEVIAATIGRALTNSDKEENFEAVPEVSLVLKEGNENQKSEVMIASKYLPDVKGNIDQYAEKEGVKKTKRHVRVSAIAGDKKEGTWNISGDENKQLRQDLAQAIAVSALCGDHDVNPGNMMALEKDGQIRIARIDFGHAFNDLIKYKSFGGKKHSKNNILDFINRETVNKFPRGDTSKLWRDYAGIMPSEEMVAAFTEMGESTKIQEGVSNAKQHFEDLVIKLKDPNVQDQDKDKTLDHIKKSIISINNNITDAKINPKDIGDVNIAIEQTFKNIDDYLKKNQEQMKNVAKVMDIQVKIDQMLTAKSEAIDPNIVKEIRNSYKEIEKNPDNLIGKGAGKGIDWVKNSKDKKAFKGDLDSFIAQRGKEMGLTKNEIELLGFKPPKKQNFFTRSRDNVKIVVEAIKMANIPKKPNTKTTQHYIKPKTNRKSVPIRKQNAINSIIVKEVLKIRKRIKSNNNPKEKAASPPENNRNQSLKL